MGNQGWDGARVCCGYGWINAGARKGVGEVVSLFAFCPLAPLTVGWSRSLSDIDRSSWTRRPSAMSVECHGCMHACWSAIIHAIRFSPKVRVR